MECVYYIPKSTSNRSNAEDMVLFDPSLSLLMQWTLSSPRKIALIICAMFRGLLNDHYIKHKFRAGSFIEANSVENLPTTR